MAPIRHKATMVHSERGTHVAPMCMYLFHLQDGVSDLEWQISPMDAKRFAAFAEQEGGLEAAQKAYAEYDELIEDWKSELVRWMDMTPPAEEASESLH